MNGLFDTRSGHCLMRSQLENRVNPSHAGPNNFDNAPRIVETQRWEELIEIALQEGVLFSVEKMAPIEGELLDQSS